MDSALLVLEEEIVGSAVEDSEPVEPPEPVEQPVQVEERLLNRNRYVNKYLERLNQACEVGDRVEFGFESAEQREKRLYGSMPRILAPLRILVVSLDFAFNRMLPKLSLTKRFYFWLTKGRYRIMTASEALGRLVSCSFSIVEVEKVENLYRVVTQKTGEPKFDLRATYGPIVRLKRVGLDGKLFSVYKIRTMSPYSEYLQAYLHKQNGLKEGGKFRNDVRVTRWGRFLRRFWLDELPMLWNVVRGEMKLVGVRPLSPHYLSLYPTAAQQLRVGFKPGLIPPFYADLPKTFEEVVESEMQYLAAYRAAPRRTDVRYGARALGNIIFGGARSA